jgi:hypothetical protein
LIGRRLLVVAVALLLAIQVVRVAAVSALATIHPGTAAKFWADHPDVEISLGLAEIGAASHDRRKIDPNTFAMLNDAAAKSPLASEPLLVRGVRAQTAGEGEAAKRAFVAAQWRDPRSMPAAYFLATYYLQSGDVLQGLEETVVLAQLSPNGADAAAPFVAAYAQAPANWPKMRALFQVQEGLEQPVLNVLARDPRNTDAVLAIADRDNRKPDSPWLGVLLSSLVASGDYGRAREVWSSVGGGHSGAGLVFDSTFSTPKPPPPFNWALASNTVGLAERQPGNRLHAIFYANADGVLASQLLTLPAGTYRLQMQLAGSPVHPETLRWSVRCDKTTEPLDSIGIDELAARGGWNFQVPANCPAQWLELSGRSGDVSQQAEATITGFSLSRAGAR